MSSETDNVEAPTHAAFSLSSRLWGWSVFSPKPHSESRSSLFTGNVVPFYTHYAAKNHSSHITDMKDGLVYWFAQCHLQRNAGPHPTWALLTEALWNLTWSFCKNQWEIKNSFSKEINTRTHTFIIHRGLWCLTLFFLPVEYYSFICFRCLSFFLGFNDIIFPGFHVKQEHHALCIVGKSVCLPLKSKTQAFCVTHSHTTLNGWQ